MFCGSASALCIVFALQFYLFAWLSLQIELRRAYNCEIMLTKVKIPLPDLMVCPGCHCAKQTWFCLCILVWGSYGFEFYKWLYLVKITELNLGCSDICEISLLGNMDGLHPLHHIIMIIVSLHLYDVDMLRWPSLNSPDKSIVIEIWREDFCILILFGIDFVAEFSTCFG